MRTERELDPSATLDEVTNRYPQTIEVFNRFGVDICCGGGVSLAEAAQRDGIELRRLMHELNDALARSSAESPR